MAQVDGETRNRIDLWLSHSIRIWEDLPNVEAEIDNWDIDDQVDYIVEWPIEEDMLQRLEAYARSEVMTEEQLPRYRVLQKIVENNRQIIERLRET